MSQTGSKERQQYLVYGWLTAGVILLAGFGMYFNGLLFQRFLGASNPPVVTALVGCSGALLLWYLVSRGWFAIYTTENIQRQLRLLGFAVAMALVAIAVDIEVKLPADLNVTFPRSLFFYPVMGFIVEIPFHVLPIAVSLFCVWLISKQVSTRAIWITIFAAAALETILQIVIGFSGQYPLWVLIWLPLQVYVINLAQLAIFRWHGFVLMFAFRLTYYLVWHIVWGHVRLGVLF